MIATVYTDGACSGNGRHDAEGGFGVFWGNYHENNLHGPLPEDERHTNNRAEYTAAIVAIQQAIDDYYDTIIIRTDSDLLIKTMDIYIDQWKENNWTNSRGMPVRNQDLIEQLDYMRTRRIDVEFEHVPGHSGHRGNEIADLFARRGAQGKTLGDYHSYVPIEFDI